MFKGYIEVACTCGLSHQVCVTRKAQVMRMAPPVAGKNPACRLHTIVFYCRGCGRKKTAEFLSSDIIPIATPEGTDEQGGNV